MLLFYFGFYFDMFVNGDISISNNVFSAYFICWSVRMIGLLYIIILHQMSNLCDVSSFLFFSDDFTLWRSELDSFILDCATSHIL